MMKLSEQYDDIRGVKMVDPPVRSVSVKSEVAQLEAEKEELRIECNRLYGIGQDYDEDNAALKHLLQKAEDVQEGKMEHSHTFCWWCGGLKHDMTKNSAFYCEGAALLAKESAEEKIAFIPTQE